MAIGVYNKKYKAMSFIPKFQTFIRWWGEGLYNGLPNTARKLFRTELPRLLLQMQDDRTVDAVWLQDGKQQSRGQFSLQEGNAQLADLLPKHAKGKPYQVELCSGQNASIVVCSITSQKRSKKTCNKCLGYQLDRLTPFTADSCFV